MVAVRYIEEVTHETAEAERSVGLRLVAFEPSTDLADDQTQRELVFQRRRLLALLALGIVSLVLIWSASVLLPGGSGGVVSSATQVELPTSHVVLPGETLWEILRERNPSGDIRAEVDQISDQLGGAALQVGQIIRFDLDGEILAAE